MVRNSDDGGLRINAPARCDHISKGLRRYMNKIVLIDTDGVEYVFSYPGLSLKGVIRELDEVVRWISSSNVHTRVVMAQGRDIPNDFLHIKSDDNALLIKVEKIDKIIIRQQD